MNNYIVNIEGVVNIKQMNHFLYLIGETGSRKSSLFKTLYGELKVGAGNISVVDKDWTKVKQKEIPVLRRKLGIIFQDFQLLTDRRVFDNLELIVLKATGWKKADAISEIIDEVLISVHLSGVKDKMPYELSGGEQQSTAITRALFNHPELILADEPTGNLDPEKSEKIIELCQFEENFSLKNYNTFGINAKAKYFSEFDSVFELKDILNSEIYQNNKSFILGGGSNLLFTQDYDGLIIHNKVSGICILEDNDDNVIVEVGGGVNWHEFVMWSVSKELSGIENLALISGTVGASPVQNIGAYGLEVKDTIRKVTALEIATQEIKTFRNEDCKFQYRNSIFKGELKKKFIIIKVEFKLSKTPLNKTTFGTIEEELKNLNLEANPKNIAEAVINIRSRKLPNPAEIGNSGSFFKNPIISTTKFKELQNEFPEIVGYKLSETETKVVAGWLIDNTGLKGFRKGAAGVHKNQASVLVNYGNASGQDIINLSELVQETIVEKYGITIEAEVNFI